MADKKALVVIDMQNDYLWEKRKTKFSYNTNELVNAVNRAISSYKEKGYDIIYIAQMFPNIITFNQGNSRGRIIQQIKYCIQFIF